MTAREILLDNGYEDIVIFDNPSYDSALIGVSSDDRAVYDYDLMIEFLIREEEMSAEEAADFISYNTIRSLPYFENSPVIIFKLL